VDLELGASPRRRESAGFSPRLRPGILNSAEPPLDPASRKRSSATAVAALIMTRATVAVPSTAPASRAGPQVIRPEPQGPERRCRIPAADLETTAASCPSSLRSARAAGCSALPTRAVEAPAARASDPERVARERGCCRPAQPPARPPRARRRASTAARLTCS
jgi:hypothetical protein